MGYYINKMENTYNQYKYQYLDHMEATIDIRENYWDFATKLFCINDYNLPPSSLVANLEIPYQQVKDISFFLATDQSRAKDAVKYNKKYSHIYESNFSVDVSSNQFLKQDINNTKIDCSIKLEIDPQVLKNAGVSLPQDAVDSLIVETSEQRWNFSMYYSNTHIISGSEIISNINGYELVAGHDCGSKATIVEIGSNDYSTNNNSINDLVYLQSNMPFQIITGKVKFNYWLEDDPTCKTLETTLLLDRTMVNEITISLNQRTSYDFVNNKVLLDTGGILGFYIPRYSHGNYEVELQINQTNTLTKLIIKNEYVFLNNINNPHITSSRVRIDSLDGFERIKWNG